MDRNIDLLVAAYKMWKQIMYVWIDRNKTMIVIGEINRWVK